jgi:hypothetical protein
MWRLLRIALLAIVLIAVAAQAWLTRATSRDWTDPLWIGVFPVNADGSDAAADYIAALEPADFASIDAFFAREAGRYDVAIDVPARVELYPEVSRRPPRLAPDAGPLTIALWSLRLRAYAWRAADTDGRPEPQIRVFVLYHDPDTSPTVPHSLGLQKGLIGVVYAFADAAMTGENGVVIAHEVLHTLGATDKYDPETLAPIWPDGYAEPERTPRHPQTYAEIMAGRRAVSAAEREMPASLASVVVGPATAREIAWIDP